MENTYINDDDERIIKNITITILLSLRRYFMNKQNNKTNLAREYLRLLNSKKRVSEAALIVNISELMKEKGWFPDEINKKLAKFFKKESDVYLKSSNLSKTLNLVKKDGFFEHIENIKNIKREFPENYARGRSKSQKREGRHSKYKLTDKVKDYQRVLNNPDALNRINKDLLSFDDTLIVFYRTAVNEFFDLIIDHGNQSIYEFYNLSAYPLAIKKVPTKNNWNRFKIYLSKLDNDERQKKVDEFVSFYTQNPQQLMFLIFALDQVNKIKDNPD